MTRTIAIVVYTCFGRKLYEKVDSSDWRSQTKKDELRKGCDNATERVTSWLVGQRHAGITDRSGSASTFLPLHLPPAFWFDPKRTTEWIHDVSLFARNLLLVVVVAAHSWNDKYSNTVKEMQLADTYERFRKRWEGEVGAKMKHFART